jgi:hypothetical protein
VGLGAVEGSNFFEELSGKLPGKTVDKLPESQKEGVFNKKGEWILPSIPLSIR